MKVLYIYLLLFWAFACNAQNDTIPPVPPALDVPAVTDATGEAVPAVISAEMKANNIIFEDNTTTQTAEAENNLQKARAEEFKTLDGATTEFIQESQLDARAAVEGARFTVQALDASPIELGEVRIFTISAPQLESLGVSQSQLEALGLSPSALETQGISLSQLEELGIPAMSPIDGIIPSLAETGLKGIVPAKEEFDIKKTDCDKGFVGPSQFDSRIEIVQLNPALPCHVAIYNNTKSVAMIVEKEAIARISSDFFQLNTGATLGNRYNLCDEEPFVKQIVVGVGTGFIIGEDIMMTAGHVFERSLSDYVVVFGYKVINRLGTAETSIAVKDIYYPEAITENYREYDMVKFRVDRKFEYPPLQWENSSGIQKGSQVYMIGYPCGLPQKLAINSDVYNNEDRHFFYSYLDSYQGNSGSPVFNYQTHKIIGVLVSGHMDYEYAGNCYRSIIYEPTDCPGEKAMRVELAFED